MTSPTAPYRVESWATTHIGKIRVLNEDAFLEAPEAGLWAVADGMGGHDAGDEASRTLIKALSRIQPNQNFDQAVDQLEELLQAGNEKLVTRSARFPVHRKPGSTIVTLLMVGNQGAVIWAGDSRLYRYRDGELEQLSHDHSHVQDLIDEGLIDAREAEQHPMANVITRAAGMDSPLALEGRKISVREGDRYLLCSDGLTRVCSHREIARELQKEDGEEVIITLLQETLDRGAPDNITLILVDCKAMESPDQTGED